ncbi:MAG: amino acid adenylation domain-containing protein, partial [bacterium]|nr:amino acid adenylation domain-containing protein [bacterium]
MTKINKKNIEEILALTPMQEGMLFHYLKTRESGAYFEQLSLEIDSEIDTGKFEAAWNTVVKTNEMLRTLFRWEKVETPVQIILKAYKIKPQYHDLSQKPPGEKEKHLENIKTKEREKNFNLEDVPFRLILCKIRKKKNVIIICNHHILYDGWSNALLVKEFVNAYHEIDAGKEPQIHAKTKFKEFVKWNRNRDKGKEKKYWQTYLREYNTQTGLSLKKGKDKETGRTNTNQITVEPTLTHRLEAYAAAHKITLASIFYTAWGLLLQKYNNSKQALFGTTVSGRNAKVKGIENIVGMFINTVPLIVETTPGEKIADINRQIDETLKKREQYENTALTDIKEYSKIEKNDELFDTIVVIENYPLEKQMGQNTKLALRSYTMEEKTHYAITLGITLFEGIEMEMSYDNGQFEKEDIDRLMKHFITMLEEQVSKPEEGVNAIDIISPEEKKRISRFNETTVEYPKNETIHQLFRRQAEKTPEKIAAIGMNEKKQTTLTYRQLNKRTDEVAAVLRKKGVNTGTIVGIMVPRSLEMLVCILGIWKAGAAYLPLDHAYPQDRIDYILRDSAAHHLIADQSLGKEIKYEKEIIDIKEIKTLKAPAPADLHAESAAPDPADTLAYVIYTSGTTGKPKGVAVNHGPIVNRMNWMQEKYGMNGKDVLLMKTAITFDVSLCELTSWIPGGATVCLLPEGEEKNPASIAETIENNNVTIAEFVPAMLKVYLNHMEEENALHKMSRLRIVLTGADTLSPELVEKFIGTLYKENKTRLINAYGPTEAAVDMTHYECTGEEARGRVPIGKPIANVQLHILDTFSREQPIGIAGELCISGKSLARGYLNNPELTAERFQSPGTGNRFFPNNQYPITNNQLYHSGDLARRLHDGNIELLGRIDHQVKIRGFRIELGEIETHLLEHETVKETVVLDRQTESGEKYLCAYIVTAAGEQAAAKMDAARLKQYLSQALPDYMVPAYFMQIEEIPLTPNEKLDRKALPEPEITTDDTYVAPGNPLQETLVQIWAQILAVPKEKIGIESDFFALGGHSLKATQLASKIHKELQVKIPLAEIFETHTIRKLAQTITQANRSTYAAIEPARKKKYYDLSSAQKRIYILQQMEENTTAYNMTEALEMEGTLDQERMTETFSKLLKRHESLRTAIIMKEEKPVQQIHENVEFELEQYSEEKNTQNATTTREDIIRQFIRPFQLSQAPLLRAGIIKTRQQNHHILIVDMHHIIADGESTGVLVNDFMALYKGERLKPLPIQYKDYSEWQNSEKEKEAVKKQAEYWKTEFPEEEPELTLPLDIARPPDRRFDGGVVEITLGEKESAAIRKIAREEKITMYMMQLAIYNIFLAKISGKDTVVTGTPVAGRRHSDLETVIGMFVNTLPLKNKPQKEKTVRQFIREIKNHTLAAFENQDYQYEELVEHLGVNRDVRRNPLFDTFFSYRNQEEADMQIPGMTLKTYPLEKNTAKFDLSLEGSDNGAQMEFEFEYSTSLYRRETIERYTNYFKRVIIGVIQHPGKKIAQIELLPEEERKQILYEFNPTETGPPCDKTISEIYREQVQRAPDHVAITGTDWENRSSEENGNAEEPPVTLSYAQLDREAGKLAQTLREKGVTPGSIVPIIAERTLQMVIGIHAILKTGAAYLPISPAAPMERIRYMTEDSSSRVILTLTGLTPLTPDMQKKIVYIPTRTTRKNDKPITILPQATQDTTRTTRKSSNPVTILPQATQDAAAYIIYTSGTTGKPKGVIVPHRALATRENFMTRQFQLEAGDIIMQKTTFTFDVSVCEIFRWILPGARLYLLPPGKESDTQYISEAIERHKITTIDFVPSMLKVFMDHIEEQGRAGKLKRIRWVFIGAETVPPATVEQFLRQLAGNGAALINGYGPTEATVDVTYYDCADQEPCITVPIGKTIDNARLYVLDENNRHQPVGIPGELYIAGDCLADGYLNAPQITAEKFPTLNIGGGRQRVYKSGDLVRWLPDGNLEFFGRIDQQVKIRGFRIEPGEIENRLVEHEKVAETVVQPLETPGGELYLCAYIVPAGENAFDAAGMEPELKEHLKQTLPEYMVPPLYVKLDQIPLMPNLKVDRKALPKPEWGTGAENAPPTDRIEENMVAIWTEILEHKPQAEGPGMSIDANFFHMGGHSLKAIVLISKIQKKFRVKIPLTTVFKNPTIRGIARKIRTAAKETGSAVKPVEKKEYYALTPAQKRIYIQHYMAGESTVYNMPAVFAIKGTLDEPRLEETIRKQVQRHESLRTAFPEINGTPHQKIYPRVEFEIEHHGKQNNEKKAAETETETETGNINTQIENIIRPFDLTEAPLMRVGIIRHQQPQLVVDMHHIISDGESVNIFIEEFVTQYAGGTVPQLTLGYKDYAAWWENRGKTGHRQKQQAYWMKRFEGELPELGLETDSPRQQEQKFEGKTLEFEITAAGTEAIKKVAREEGATTYMAQLAIYNILLARMSGKEEIIVGTPTAGREDIGGEPVIGMFVNTLAIRNYPEGKKTYREFLKEVKKRALEDIENSHYQYDELVAKLGKRGTGHNPLFDVLFVMQNEEEEQGIETAGLRLEPVPFENNTAKFDLTLTGIERREQLNFVIEYSTALFREKTVKRYINYYKRILAAVAAAPDEPIGEVEILTPREKQQQLYKFNRTAAEYPHDKTIHQLFEEQEEKTPDRISISGTAIPAGAAAQREQGTGPGAGPANVGGIHESPSQPVVQLTYRQLNEQAHNIAKKLRDNGVGPDTIVAVMVQRNLQMVAALLGILKAGGAYMPIEPDYPRERIEYMLKDSNTGLLLVDEKTAHQEPETEATTGNGETTPQNQQGRLTVLNLEHRETEDIHETGTRPDNRQPPTSLAYVIYTSGTTGKPKGSLIEHRNVVRLMKNDKKLFDFNHHDVWTMFHSYCFDFSVWEMYGALLYGGKLLVIPKETAKDLTHYYDKLVKEGVTVLNQTPPAFYNLAQIDKQSEVRQLKLRYVIFGGDVLKPLKLKEWQKRYPQTKHINMFGITETTVHVTYKALEERDIRINISNIGTPIPTITTYVMDRYGKLAPLGVPGEIYVGGDGVCRGYLNRPDITAEKFLENPYKPGERMYRSGDLAKLTENGDMEYRGRIDHQVKIRGYRIEMGEIENRLLRHHDIKEAVVQAKTKEEGDKYLCAYIVPTGTTHPQHAAPHQLAGEESRFMTTYLSAELPEYMIPAYFIQINKIPLTANGKVDRRALPEVEMKKGKTHIKPRTPLERHLVDIWAHVLGKDKNLIGIDQTLFDLGGHSLTATQLMLRIHKEFNIKIPLTTFFAEPTIRAAAAYIEKKTGEAAEGYAAIEPAEKKEYYNLSPAQKRLYILHQLDQESTGYNMPQVLTLTREAEPGRLEEAFRRLIARHESLRTTFRIIKENPVQVIHRYDENDFFIHRQETSEGESGVRKIVEGFVRPFDLTQAPLLRAGLIQTRDRQLLVLDMHHIITDGTSQEQLIKEYFAHYKGEQQPHQGLQYKDYAEWRRRKAQREIIKKQEGYWLGQYSGEIPELQLPYDRPRPEMQSFEGAALEFKLKPEETQVIKENAAETQTTLYMVLLALYTLVLAKLSGQEDIIVGTPVAARRHADLTHIIGMFVNTLAIRNYPEMNKTFSGYLQQIRRNTINAYENQEYQFEDLVEKIAVRRDMTRNPLFDVMFNHLNQGETAAARGTTPHRGIVETREQSEYGYQNRTAKFDLNLAAQEIESEIQFDLEYATKLFDSETIRRIIGYIKHLVAQLAIPENRDVNMAQLQILSEKEKQEILDHSRGKEEAYEPGQTLHDMFAKQAAKTPEAIAIVGTIHEPYTHGENVPVTLTYRQLDERSDSLAQTLREKGVQTGTIVAIMAKRSIGLITGLLAILKAGGANLPIEPKYPQERIDYMLKDSNAPVLLTETTFKHKIPTQRTPIYLDKPENLQTNQPATTHTPTSPNNQNPITNPLAYVIYTSGTTGKPKGVMLEHRNLVNLLEYQNRHTTIDFSKVLQFTTISFDVSFQEIFSTIIFGGELYLNDEETRDDVAAMFRLIDKNE